MSEISDSVSPARDDDADPRPGPVAWAAIALGWIVMGVAVLGAFSDERLGGVSAWVRWVVGSALIHDLLLLPVVLGAGWLLTRLVPATWRAPIRTALIVAAIVALSVWPIAMRWGARADNPSILPLPVARNLAVLVAVVLLAGIGAGAVAAWRERAPGRAASDEPS